MLKKNPLKKIAFALTLVFATSCSTSLKHNKLEIDLSGSQQESLNKKSFEFIKTQQKYLEEQAQQISDQDFLKVYNLLTTVMSNGANASELFIYTHTDKELRERIRKDHVQYSQLESSLYMSKPIYDRFAKINLDALADNEKHLVKKVIKQFIRNGVDKDQTTRDRIAKLQKEITEVGNEFSKNLSENTKSLTFTEAQLKGAPQDYIESHRSKEDPKKIVITTSRADVATVSNYVHSPKVRKEVYLAFRSFGYPMNKPVLYNLIKKRHELATLIGYKHYADYITSDKMTGSAKNARQFINNMMKVTYKKTKQELNQLLKEKRKTSKSSIVYDYERKYLKSKVIKANYNVDFQEVRQYFEYTKVRRGIFDMTKKLFNVDIKKANDVKVWHPDVEAYNIFDGRRQIGRFFMDNFPREGKYAHAAHFPIRKGVKGLQLPQSSLVMNMPDPKKSNGVALLEYSQVRTFLHEFGHLLHHIFGGQQTFVDQSGTSTEWDFVEAPSQMLEEWLLDPITLQSFAIHHKTKKPIPLSLIKKLKKMETFGRGIFVRRQLFLSDLSLKFYSTDPAKLDIDKYFNASFKKYRLFKNIKNNPFPYNFGHLSGYSAIYYTYMWSLSISKDLLSPFKKNGLYDKNVARQYREKILAPGGSRPAAESVKDFLGRSYNLKAFKHFLEGA